MCFGFAFKTLPSTIQYDGLPQLDEIYEDLPLLPAWMFNNVENVDEIFLLV